ncbi:hypothetical protein AgCh_002221 [Apium graveolens]
MLLSSRAYEDVSSGSNMNLGMGIGIGIGTRGYLGSFLEQELYEDGKWNTRKMFRYLVDSKAFQGKELDANLETPMTDLEFFKYVYNIDEQTIKKIMESLEAMISTQPAPEVPLSPASQRKRDTGLLVKARMTKKNRLMLYPHNSLSESVGANEAAKLNMSQQASQTSIPDDAYSLIRRVLSEVSIMVKSLEGIDGVVRAELNEMMEKLATVAFPDKTGHVQQSSRDQYMRIRSEIIDQVMRNFEKVIVDVIYIYNLILSSQF